MSKTFHHGERRIRVRGVRRSELDVKRLARALIDLAQAQAAAEAEAEHKRRECEGKETSPGKRDAA
jgi:hypothetical protein